MGIPLFRQIQRQNFTDWKKLLSFLHLEELEGIVDPHSKFPLNLPLRLAQKIGKGNGEDPILRQFLPTLEEQKPSPLFCPRPRRGWTLSKNSKTLT